MLVILNQLAADSKTFVLRRQPRPVAGVTPS